MMLKLRNYLLALALLMIAPGGIAHNKVQNKIVVQQNASGYRVHSRSIVTDFQQGIQLNLPDSLNFNSQRFGDLIVSDVFIPKSISSFAAQSKNQSETIVIRTTEDREWSSIYTENQFVIDLNQTQDTTEMANSALRYFELGVEHILIGLDHLLFILALLFIVKRKDIIWIITSFTLAHSITLGLASSGTFLPIDVGLSSIWVESMIAVSIVLLALEMRRGDNHSTIKAAAVAFSFGLLHGFGFASVLTELGLPPSNFWSAILSFNLGVEAGQLVFIGILAVIYRFIKNLIQFDLLTYLVSLLVGGVAAFWSFERIFELANII